MNLNEAPQSVFRRLFLIWLGWLAIMLVFQALVPLRLGVVRPDYALGWTQTETLAGSQVDKIYLTEPFMNQHVSWDSEFYLAIAVAGYDAPGVRHINATFGGISYSGEFWRSFLFGNHASTQSISLAYAFFPLYPLAIRLLALPLAVFGLTPIATATLAGVLVSALGALAAMVALYHLALPELGDEGALRTAFYLLIFPSGFFLAQVYTEGLFIGLAFSSLLLMRRGRLGWAAALAVLATFTRAVGVALSIPLLLAWIREGDWRDLDMEWRQVYFNGIPWRIVGRGLLALAPVVTFLLWRISFYGFAFNTVEEQFFGRGLLALGASFVTWREAFQALFGPNPQASAYYLIEWAGILLGFTACIAGFKRHPDLALFGLLVVFLSFTSGPAQGMHRYILAAPPVFLFLARQGRRPAFDRAWTILSILIMGMLVTLFSFDMWTG